VQAADVENCQAVLRTVAAELAAKAAVAIPAELEVDETCSIRGVFTDPEDELSEPASVAPQAYVSRLLSFFDCSREVYIIAQVYINRLLQKHPSLVIQASSVNEMLLASVILALKWHEEVCEQYPDVHYALYGGVSAKKLKQLETRFLELLGWEMHVSPSEFHTHCGMAAALKVELTARRHDGKEAQEEDQEGEVAEPLTATITGMASPTYHDKAYELHSQSTCDDGDDEDTCKEYEDEEDDCFPGRPLWGPQSYWMPSACNVSNEDLPHVNTEEFAHSVYSFTSDCDECLPGKPLWGDQSYRMSSFCSTSTGTSPASGNKEIEHDESDDEDCLPGRPLWSTRSFKVASRCSTSPGTSLPDSEAEEDWESDGDCLPGRPLWSAQSYKASNFANMPLGSHKQFNGTTNAHTHSQETIRADKDRGFSFKSGFAANILDNKFVERMGVDLTPPCTDGLVPCPATEIVCGQSNIATSPVSAGPWSAPLRLEGAGTPQEPTYCPKQAQATTSLTNHVFDGDPPCPWLPGDDKKPELHFPHNQPNHSSEVGQQQQQHHW